MPVTVALDDLPVTEIGWSPIAGAPLLRPAARRHVLSEIAGAQGARVSERTLYPPKEGSLTLFGRFATVAARLAAEDALVALLDRGEITLTVSDGATVPRSVEVVRTTIDWERPGGFHTALACTATVGLLAARGAWRTLNPTGITFGSVPVPIPIGNLPQLGEIWINGSANQPVLTYLDAAGNSVVTIALAGNLTGTDWYRMSLTRRSLQRSGATYGAWTDAAADLTTGRYFFLDPKHGDIASGAYPMLAVSLGVGVYIGPSFYA